MAETVDHPLHYGGAENPYEVIRVLESWLTREEFIGGLKFNVLKYLARHRQKGGVDDLKKALWYQERLVEFVERTGANVGPLPVVPRETAS